VQSGRHLDNRREPAMLSSQLGELRGIPERTRVREGPLDFVGAGESGR